MQRVFEQSLNSILPLGWSAKAPAGWSASYSAFSQYDIGARQRDKLMALTELALGDANVAHALHNGELKLLGNCSGLGVSTRRPFSSERGLTSDDIRHIGSRLQDVPIRGLFFVGPGPVLDIPKDTVWFETKQKGFGGETRFHSALFPAGGKATLRQVFGRLAEEGLYCWFYSLCGEESLEFLPHRGVPLGAAPAHR